RHCCFCGHCDSLGLDISLSRTLPNDEFIGTDVPSRALLSGHLVKVPVERGAPRASQEITEYRLRQRATLVLLLHQHPLVSNIEAAARVQLHLRSVQRWRRRWATGDFSLEDEPGRGRKADFPPPGSC